MNMEKKVIEWYLSPSSRITSFLLLFLFVALVLILCWNLFLYIYFFDYALPVADDICRANVNDWLNHTIELYFQWTGRWVSMAIHTFTLTHVKEYIVSDYYLLLLPVNALFISVFFLITFSLLKEKNRTIEKIFFSVFLIVIYLLSLPYPGETLYWWHGNIEYQLSFFFLFVSIASLICSCNMKQHRKQRVYLTLLGIMTGVIVTGIHELAAILYCMVVFLGLLWSYFYKIFVKTWLTALTFAGIGTAITIFAPGNFVRAEKGDFSVSFIQMILSIFDQATKLYAPWLLDPIFIFSMLFAVCFALTRFDSLRIINSKIKSKFLLFSSLYSIFILVILSTFIGLTVGDMPNGRTQNFLYTSFFFIMTFNVLMWAQFFVSRNPATKQFANPRLNIFICVALLITIFSNSNFSVLNRYYWNKQVIKTWHAQMIKRYSVGTNTELNNREVVFQSIDNIPLIYFQTVHLTAESSDWKNKCFAKFTGVNSVTVNDNYYQSEIWGNSN
ncbi:MAG: DUF6056 family protein [Paraglaciecola sp.]|uniref:DUF6056 family protein n=1 Tax=Paraglaciecola sp. TaxID=1920173 RepID=UPI0032981D6D